MLICRCNTPFLQGSPPACVFLIACAFPNTSLLHSPSCPYSYCLCVTNEQGVGKGLADRVMMPGHSTPSTHTASTPTSPRADHLGVGGALARVGEGEGDKEEADVAVDPGGCRSCAPHAPVCACMRSFTPVCTAQQHTSISSMQNTVYSIHHAACSIELD